MIHILSSENIGILGRVYDSESVSLCHSLIVLGCYGIVCTLTPSAVILYTPYLLVGLAL